MRSYFKKSIIKRHKNTFALLIIAILFIPYNALAKTIKFYLDDFNPLAYEKDGEIKGVLVEWAKLIENKSNISFEIVLAPTARMVKSFEYGDADISIQAKIDDLFQYVIPIAEIPSYPASTFSLKENRIESLEDLYGKTVCVLRGSTYGEAFDNNKQIIKYHVPTYRQIIQMVMKKRCFAGVAVMKGLEFRLQALGYHIEQFAQPFPVHPVPLYLVISKKNTDEKFIPIIVKAVEELKDQGAFKKVVDNYEILNSDK